MRCEIHSIFPTFESNAHIVALSPNGEYYWDIEYPVESVFYYDEHSVRSSIDLHFYESYMLSNRYVFSSEDGRLLFELSRSDIELPQEIVNTLDNPQQFLNTWEESELDFITGESGEVYILSSFYNPQTSDSHNYLMEISLQDQSIEVISINQTVLGNTSEQINNNGIIVSYWAFANFMRISNLSPPYQNTEIILDENTYSLFNNETGQVLACDADRDTAVTTCIYYPPFETEIHFSIEGVTSIYRWSMDWENGILYLFDRRKVLHVIQCPIP